MIGEVGVEKMVIDKMKGSILKIYPDERIVCSVLKSLRTLQNI
jgi:hypothetical protein